MSITSEQQRHQTNYKRAKVLVIDDNDDHWMLIHSALKKCLPEITSVRAANSDEALALLDDWGTQEWEIPKLILLDLYLPEREDGWNLLERIKVMPPPCNHIPVIMFSSSDNHNDVSEAYQRGVSSYLVKPVDFEAWLAYFKELRAYWWETVTLPPMQFSV